MVHLLPLLIHLLYIMFTNGSSLDSENTRCSVCLSSGMSSLNCKNEWSHLMLKMKTYEKSENITINTSSSITDLFFKAKNSRKLLSFQCSNEIVMVEETLRNYLILQKNCSRNSISLGEFQTLIGTFSVIGLEVSNSNWPIIELEDYSNLLTLNIHDNIFRRNISKNILNFPSSLKRLSINDNGIQFFSKDLFSHLSSLIQLDLSGNNLEEIYLQHFERLGRLENLDLSRNSLRKNKLSVLKPLTQLNTLNMSGNLLGRADICESSRPFLSDEDFIMCEVFQDRHLSFQKIAGLRNLDISNNEMIYLTEFVFWNLFELEFLNLSKNNLRSLTKNVFKDLYNLRYLDLSFNKLTSFHELTFEKLSSMRSLNISFNRLEYLNPTLIQNMNNLTVFDMKNNRIQSFDFNIFKYQKLLVYFDASQNTIANISNFETTEVQFSNIDFSQNKIQSFVSIQHFLPQLKSLKLDYNYISNLNFLQDLAYLTNLSHSICLSLTYNRIPNFNISNFVNAQNYFESYDLDFWLNSNARVYLDISFNPIICDCHSYPLYKYLKKCKKILNFINLQNVKCQSPDFLENNTLPLIPDEEFSCLFTENCPISWSNYDYGDKITSCDCGIRTKDNKIFVNCSNRGLDRVIEEPPIGTLLLFFQQNKLKNLTSLNSDNWMNLTDINVNDNDIGTLKEWIIPPKLHYLSLRGNRLKSLSTNVTEFIISQDHFELFFGRNERSCDCESEDFKKVIIEKPEFVKDIEDIICDYEENGRVFSRQLISVPDFILCEEEFAFYFARKIFISSFTILFLILVAAIVTYIRKRFVIHSLLYIHCNKLCCFKSSDSDSEDKVFDAFVAYNSSDCQIALDLIEELERKEPSFRLCIHERDWLPGQFIYENIVNSVQNSKRTIIVLSDNFIASPWFKVELNAAMSKDQMNPFIVILVDKSVTFDKIEKHFRRVISKKTYLIWGERWFWEKLRYAMPHKKGEDLETSI